MGGGNTLRSCSSSLQWTCVWAPHRGCAAGILRPRAQHGPIAVRITLKSSSSLASLVSLPSAARLTPETDEILQEGGGQRGKKYKEGSGKEAESKDGRRSDGLRRNRNCRRSLHCTGASQSIRSHLDEWCSSTISTSSVSASRSSSEEILEIWSAGEEEGCRIETIQAGGVKGMRKRRGELQGEEGGAGGG